MKVSVSNIQKWCFTNLDLTEEILEKNSKAVVLVAGASSSGKSYASNELKELFSKNGLRALSLSTDDYSKGISGIITDKVNQNIFSGGLSNITKIKNAVKNVIINSDFDKKFDEENLKKIESSCVDFLSKENMAIFLNGLVQEFSEINFDEPSVYDLKQLAVDVNSLLSGNDLYKRTYSMAISEGKISNTDLIKSSDYDIIIIEGIYALNNVLLSGISSDNKLTNFIQSNDKTLFLRRVIRDASRTTADNCFTVKNYLKYVMPGYKKTILPSKVNAQIVLQNDMTFDELVDSATWNIIQGLMKGEPLRSLVYQVVSTLARLWKQ